VTANSEASHRQSSSAAAAELCAPPLGRVKARELIVGPGNHDLLMGVGRPHMRSVVVFTPDDRWIDRAADHTADQTHSLGHDGQHRIDLAQAPKVAKVAGIEKAVNERARTGDGRAE
jgi:hypothetical protein